MLKESNVISAVCDFLESKQFSIVSRCTELQRGYDIVARHPLNGKEVRIEAKGETSSKPETKRFGLPFTNNQVYDHVSKAFYCAAIYAAAEVYSGVAFPKNAAHIKQVSAIEPILKQLKIEVFWVATDRKVEVLRHWHTWE